MRSLRHLIGLLLLALRLGAADPDSAAVASLHAQAFDNIYSEPKLAKSFVLKALKKSKAIKNCLLEASSYNILGIVYDVTSDYDSAIFCYTKAIALSEDCGHEVMKAQAVNNLGLIYWNMGELDKAIGNYMVSLKIFEKFEKEKGVANTLNNIAVLYTDKRDIPRAIPFHKKALAMRQKIGDSYGLSVTYANLGKVYMELDVDSARYFIMKSIALKDSLKDRHGLGINYNNLGVIFKLKGQPDSALVQVRKALRIRSELGEKNLVAADYCTLAGLYIDLEKYQRAYKMLDSAEVLAREVDAKTLLLTIYGRYVNLDTLTGNYLQAVRHLRQRMHYQDEFFSVEKEKVINEIQTRYETEKKERELAENRVTLAEEKLKLKQSTAWTLVLVSVLALFIVSGFYIYRQQKLKQQKLKEEARLREELARAEVQARIQEERVRISRDLHDHIGSQLTIISSSVDNLAYAEKDEGLKSALLEISDLGRDTMLQLRETIWAMNQEAVDIDALVAKTREFVSRLKLSEQAAEVVREVSGTINISPVVAINIYRIVQEAVNNAVKYADFQHLVISFTKLGQHLFIRIIDDGKGFNVSASGDNRGYGLINMEERARQFGGELNLKSTPGKGTELNVTVPLNKANYV